MRLEGKISIITGAASGIGESACELFAQEGSKVIAVDRDADKLNEVVERIRRNGGVAEAMIADLASAEESKRIVHDSYDRFGRVDILWNNAGVIGPTGIEDMNIDSFQDALDINLRSCVLATSVAIPYMRQQGGGSILFTSSMSGLTGSRKSPIYSATKYGVIGVAQSLAQAYAADNIRINAICPGVIETPLGRSSLNRGMSQEATRVNTEGYLNSTPMKRFGRPVEVAYAGLWLASEEASYVTGIALPVDGGYTCV